MSRDENYPDDIRQYDDDPRSPFYTGDDWMDEPIEQLANDWDDELEKTGIVEELDITLADILAVMGKDDDAAVQVYLTEEAERTVRANPERFLTEPDYEALEWD